MTDEDASMKTGPGKWAVADEGERCKAVGGWRVLQEVRALTRRITRHEERTLSIGVMKLAMLLVWLMMASVSYWPSPYPSTRTVVAWTPTAVTTTERPSF